MSPLILAKEPEADEIIKTIKRRLEEEDRPMSYLYRYLRFNRRGNRLTDWEDNRLKRILIHNELYFALPMKLNDPFDCKTLFTFEGSDEADFRKFFYSLLRHKFRNLSEKGIKKKVDSIIEKKLHENPQWRKDQIETWLKIQLSENAKLGVLCLSKQRDDILMWSHYADGHTGFCLEFDKEGLKSWNFCGPVRYRKVYPTFKEFVNCPKELHRLFLLRKSDHWKYEKEWRVIVPRNRHLRFPDHLLTGVILGCQMPERNRNMICRWAESRRTRPKLYRSYKKENQYGLVIEEIR